MPGCGHYGDGKINEIQSALPLVTNVPLDWIVSDFCDDCVSRATRTRSVILA